MTRKWYEGWRRVWTRQVHDRLPDGTLVLNEAESDWEWYEGPWALAMDDPVLDQDHFRGYEPGTEAGSSGIALEDTNFSRNTATPFQFRILVQESGGLAGSGNLKVQLQVDKNSTTFANVDATSSNVQSAADPNITDNAVTTNRLTGGTGTFVAGRFDEVDGLSNTNVIIALSGFTEYLFSVTIIDADVANDDTLDFRLVKDDLTVLDNYNVIGRVTVIKAAGGLGIPIAAYHHFHHNLDIG